MTGPFIPSENFAKILNNAKDNPNEENLVILAKHYNYRSFIKKSIETSKKVLSINNQNWDAWYELIMASGYRNYSELEKIKEQLDNYFDNPKDDITPDFLKIIALINYFLEEDGVARNVIEKAIDLDNKNATLYEVKGYILHAGENFEEAISAFGKAIELDPNSCRSMRMIGKCLLELGDNKKAVHKIQQSLRVEPSYLASWHLLGEYYFEQKQIIEGYQCFAKAASINPKDWGTYFIMAEYFMYEGQYDIAIAEVKKLLLFESDATIQAEALNLIGYANYLKGDKETAKYYYSSALAINSEYSLAYYNLGEIELKSKKYDKAIYYFSECLKRDKHHIPAITQTGFAYLNLKKNKEAVEMFNIALELDPYEYWAYLGLSEEARALKNYKQQLEYAIEASKIAPKNSNVQNYIAIAYQCNNDFDFAEKHYLLSLKYDNFNRKSANNLAYLYEKLIKKSKLKEEKDNYRKKAVEAWEVRLLSCKASSSSIVGSKNHLKNLGVQEDMITELMRTGNLSEHPLIQRLESL